jgi:ATP/maltotriose-dependent transcriptional regulator MalT
LARWRARNQLAEIRANDLRFHQEEATTFFNEVMGLTLTTEEIATLEAYTEGWIAGLQLAALSLQGRSYVTDYIQAFSGSHVYIGAQSAYASLSAAEGRSPQILDKGQARAATTYRSNNVH